MQHNRKTKAAHVQHAPSSFIYLGCTSCMHRICMYVSLFREGIATCTTIIIKSKIGNCRCIMASHHNMHMHTYIACCTIILEKGCCQCAYNSLLDVPRCIISHVYSTVYHDMGHIFGVGNYCMWRPLKIDPCIYLACLFTHIHRFYIKLPCF